MFCKFHIYGYILLIFRSQPNTELMTGVMGVIGFIIIMGVFLCCFAKKCPGYQYRMNRHSTRAMRQRNAERNPAGRAGLTTRHPPGVYAMQSSVDCVVYPVGQGW